MYSELVHQHRPQLQRLSRDRISVRSINFKFLEFESQLEQFHLQQQPNKEHHQHRLKFHCGLASHPNGHNRCSRTKLIFKVSVLSYAFIYKLFKLRQTNANDVVTK